MTDAARTQIMEADQIRRAITRIAHEICERNKGADNLVLIGLIQRGDVLAQRIAEEIQRIEGLKPPLGALDITFHRDDNLQNLKRTAAKRPSHLPFNLEGKLVILVDDVLYTGRSIRAAMDELNDYGRPQAIQLAVLVDRGHRELPIHADFVGKNVPTAQNQKIIVELKERGQTDGIYLVAASKPSSRKEG
jgi:pyrimidine operon attenuation protein / uracil phosphoribosyltransferase